MILTIVIAFFSLIVLVIFHEFGHFILAKKFGVRVEEFGVGYPPRIFGKKIGQTVYSLNLLPFGAFVKIYGEEGGIEDYRSFVGKPIWQKVSIVLGGVAAFWVVAAVLFSIVFAIGAQIPIPDDTGSTPVDARVIVADVSSGSPAQKADLKTNDAILNVVWQTESVKIDKIKSFQDFVAAHKGQEIVLTVQRGSQILDISLTPRVDAPKGQGALGVGLQRMAQVIQKQPWYLAPVKGVLYCGELTGRSVVALANLVGGLFSGKGMPSEAAPAGPLGITILLAKAFDFGPGFFIYFIGAISVLVAISNLLPIPALDGGKLIFLLIEKIRKRAVSPKVEQNITMVFFVLLILFSIVVTIKFDIPRLSDFIKTGS